LQVLDATDREAVGAIIVIGGIHAGRIEVEVIGVRAIRTARPVVAVRALIVKRGIAVIAVAGYRDNNR